MSHPDSDEQHLNIIQRQLRPWQAHNFPGRPSWQPLLGAVEELGELAHSFLKREQDIRGTADEHAAKIKDAVADTIIFLCDFANAEGFSVDEVLVETWLEVRERNWREDRGPLPEEVTR